MGVRTLVFSLVAACALAFVPAASATVPTQSNVTAPADPSYLTDDQDAASPTTVTVSGTSDGAAPDQVDLRCYYAATSETIATGVALDASGNFTKQVPASAFTSGVPAQTCVLRAVPTGTTPAAAPGSSSPLAGPRIAPGSRSTSKASSGSPSDYTIERAQLAAYDDYYSAGSCGLADSFLFDPSTFAPSQAMFYCDDYMTQFDGSPGASATPATRSELRVDGLDAYLPGSTGFTSYSGFPALSYTQSVDPATGNLAIAESQLAVVCAPNPHVWPAGSAGCTSFAPAGVRLERTIVEDHDGQLVTIHDRWSSTDGHPHQLDLEVEHDFHGSAHDTGFEFPWVSSQYLTHAAGDTEPGAPSAPGSFYVKESNAAADGDPTHPQGAVTYSSPPDGVRFIFDESGGGTRDALVLRYVRTLPASSSLGLTFAYATGSTLAAIQSLAHGSEAAFQPPSISIASPAPGSTSRATPVTVTGHASANVPIEAVDVNGVPATLGPGGSWSAQVPLNVGPNTLTATASTIYQVRSQAQETVNFALPPTPPSPHAKLTLIGRLRAIANGFRFKLRCQLAPCHGAAVLTVVERVEGRHVLRLARHRARWRTVVVGRTSFTISAGRTRTLSVSLDRAGRRLLRRFGRMKLKLTIVLVQGNGKPIAVKTAKRTFRRRRR
jgi:hypothetical protein